MKNVVVRLAAVASIAALVTVAAWAGGGTEKTTSGGGAPAKAEPYRFRLAYGPWDTSNGRIDPAQQPNDPYFQWVEKRLGVVPLTDSWEWQGSAGYVQGLRLALASGEKYEALRPWDRILAQELIDSGIAIPLDDLLKKSGSNVQALFTETQWDAVRAQGNGKIFFFPQKGHPTASRAGLVRKDWLDRVGLKVPTTKDEYVAMLRAFKAKDANGNGDPNDEIPVSGREQLRWFDDLFVMYGVMMYEGHPQWKWNAAKGIYESAQVAAEMKEALAFIRELYAEGLIDSVMPVQKAADWSAKINANKVGSYFHLMGSVDSYSKFIAEDPAKDESGMKYWEVMPQPPQVSGKPRYKNIYPIAQEPNFMITKYAKDPAAIMRWYDFGCSPEHALYQNLGIEGKDWKRVDGKIQIITPLVGIGQFRYTSGTPPFVPEILKMTALGEFKAKAVAAVIDAGLEDLEAYNMPNSVYKGFEDYAPASAKLYREVASRIIIGEKPLSDWDAYVKEWYAKGGQEVTDRATAWYKKYKGIK